MRSKISLMALAVRVLALSLIYFASFTASLYLPHQSPWWRVAMIVLIVVSSAGAVRQYRRRIEVRQQNIGKDLGRA
jgi:membrane protein implicated in regulation of membrane protease activity